MKDESENSLSGLGSEARELILEHRWVVRSVVNKLCRSGWESERDELTSAGYAALVEWTKGREGGPGFSRGAWLRVEGAARDHLRRRRRDRDRLVQSMDHAGMAFVWTCEAHDPDAESPEDLMAAISDEAFGLVAARLLGAVATLHQLTPEQVVIARQELARASELLEAAMAELPQRDHHILELHYFQGMDLAEVAERMSPPIPYSSLTRFHRDALVRLGKILRRRGLHGSPR